MTEAYDVIVAGGGSGGVAAAVGAARGAFIASLNDLLMIGAIAAAGFYVISMRGSTIHFKLLLPWKAFTMILNS